MSWEYLKKGDIVDLIAPGYGIKPNEIESCAEYIRNLGLVPRIPNDLLGEDLFSSNNEEARSRQLISALYAKDSAAVWCIKGGYGTANLLQALSKGPKPEHQKCVIGFSDITALHLFLQHQWGWQTLHAPVVWQCIKKRVNSRSQSALQDLICGQNKQQNYDLTPLNKTKTQHIEGNITGGNLMLVQSSIATNWQIESKGNIIFLEDIDENAYRVDRMLNHLHQAQIFNHAQALIFGDFVCKTIEDQSRNIAQLQQNFADKIGIPTFEISGIGHGKTNLPLPLGTSTIIDGTNNKISINNK